ncbi:MAG TPA: hypothetical protein VFC60_01435 [Tissierellaceae bacterium]|nr:hypothetical protein [Tissierellaceae bacterium]
MKNKRVGTISMGIVLIFFGILIFISQVSSFSAVELFIKFWPGILIILGLEILYYVYTNKSEETKIKYDGFSIFIVTVILILNMFIYGLMETGVMDLIKLKVSQEIYYERYYR